MCDVGAEYNTSQVNIVAHSMGGLDAIKYIEGYGIHPGSHLPHVDHLVTLGTPVFGSPWLSGIGDPLGLLGSATGMPAINDLGPWSPAIWKLFGNRHAFDSNTSVLSVAGTGIAWSFDGAVDANSALGLRLFTNNFTGATAPDTHSQLHDDLNVIKRTEQFLWK